MTEDASRRQVKVLIAGGGPVGLVLSILLSLNKVDHLLVETRAHPSTHPKARGISARSMEILRLIGLENQVRSAGLPAEQVAMYRGTSLVDPQFTRTSVSSAIPGQEVTPSPGVLCPQNVLEAILIDQARRLAGNRIRFGHQLMSSQHHPDSIRSLVKDIDNERISEIESQYLVGCDGARSMVRQLCGIAMDGQTGLRYYLSVRFRAPLGAVVADRASASYFMTPPGRGGFMAIDNDTDWIYQYPFDPEAEDPENYDEQRWIPLIRAAAGIEDLDVTVVDTMAWRMDACVATSYRCGRVLLAGDAAHLIPPTGGHGMNLGIGDADNLAVKLAAVLTGLASDALLESYETERRPIAMQVRDIATTNAHSRGNYRIDDELLLTANYASSTLDTTGYTPHAQPGCRLPHWWLTGPDGRQSTLDLIGSTYPRFTLLYGPAAARQWQDQATEASIATAVLAPPHWAEFASMCGLTDTTGLLVRPDQHIAWRADTPPPAGTLQRILRALLAGNL
ncbi:MAG: FAD-dependent monooxygenase [Mycobacteriaceae bacterium]|nr:FAD-dependent monooxygenase [Mycobacteriaceae bacterium]